MIASMNLLVIYKFPQLLHVETCVLIGLTWCCAADVNLVRAWLGSAVCSRLNSERLVFLWRDNQSLML